MQAMQAKSINMLPDGLMTRDVLLEIFDFCSLDVDQWLYAWQTLVHVCRRWRHVVFGSPRRLNLQLVCSTETPARGMLDVLPPLPLLIYANESETSGVENVVAALERSNRVREISISISRSRSEELWKAMEEPHPELTFLKLEWNNEDEPVSILPDSFLGGFRFRDYRNYLCRPLTSLPFGYSSFRIHFTPSRWSQAFPH